MKKYSKLVSDFTEASRCSEVSYIAAEGQAVGLERKYHSGNDSVVDLQKANIRLKLPSRVHSNVVPICLKAGTVDVYIFPDCIWAYSNGIFGSIPFDRLRAESALSRLTVSIAPTDGTVIDHTWRYVNMKGGPDRRFRNNPQLPIVLYSILKLSSPLGLHYRFYFSRQTISEVLRRSLAELSRSTEEARNDKPRDCDPMLVGQQHIEKYQLPKIALLRACL
jgi:hypothetical protein